MLKLMTPLNVLVCIAVFYLVFALLPSLDVQVSSYFYYGDDGFRHEVDPDVRLVRRALFYVIISGVVATVFFRLVQFIFPSILPVWFQERGKIFEVVSLIYLFGPILLVNGVLKEYWGRARPTDIKEFSGSLDFTAPFEIAGQCPTNCSFVSGEGAGATAYLIGVFLVYSVSNRSRGAQCLVVLATFGAILVMGLRIAMGAHFLSDTVFSFLFVVLIASLILRLKRYRQILK